MEKLFDGEYKLMEVLWEAGAVHSAQLVELCAQRLGWNKSTTYTVLRRLKNKGAVDHRDTVVTPCSPGRRPSGRRGRSWSAGPGDCPPSWPPFWGAES